MKKNYKSHEDSLFTSSEWPFWLMIHHFLPAKMKYDLLSFIVLKISKQSITIDDLFNVNSSNDGFLDEVFMTPKHFASESVVQFSLSNLIRAIAWDYDDYFHIGNEIKKDNPSYADFKVAIGALRFGGIDLNNFGNFVSGQLFESEDFALYPQFSNFIQVLISREKVDTFLEEIEMNEILKGLLVKHIGDMYADIDDWVAAQKWYHLALTKFTSIKKEKKYSKELNIWIDICKLSIASSTNYVTGAAEASLLIVDEVASSSIIQNPILKYNGTLDVMAYSDDNPNWNYQDMRGVSLKTSLINQNLDVAPAFKKWMNENLESSHRVFWAVIRRLLANGSNSEVKSNKYWYALSILDRPAYDIKKEDFLMGLKLLLESEIKSKTAISKDVIGTNLTLEIVRDLHGHAQHLNGSRINRLTVLVKYYKEWFPQIFSLDAKKEIFNQTLAIAKEFKSSFYSQENAGGEALDALTIYADNYPEIIKEFSNSLEQVICQKIMEEAHWTGRSSSLKLAVSILNDLEEKSIVVLVECILKLLDSVLNPNNQMWPIVRPAMGFLTSERVKEIAVKYNFSNKIKDQIISYGVSDPSLINELFFNLLKWDEQNLIDEKLRVVLRPVINSLLKELKNINSTASVGTIRSLLLASHFLTIEEFKEVIDTIITILKTTKTNGKKTIAFTDVYFPILDLIENYNVEIIDKNKKGKWLDDAKEIMLLEIVKIWKVGAENPLIFSSFSIPEATRVNPIIVNNWAVTSIRLAKICQKIPEIELALDTASKNKDLLMHILKARISEKSLEDTSTHYLYFNNILSSTQDKIVYYKILPELVTSLLRQKVQERSEIILLLLNKTLRLGPDVQDATIFLLALSESDCIGKLDAELVDLYWKRLNKQNEQFVIENITPYFNEIKNTLKELSKVAGEAIS